MRRLITLITLVFVLTIQAQDRPVPTPNNQQHMKFMGMKMGGDFSTFVNKLKQKGFKEDYTNSNKKATLLMGKFAGYDDCMLMVYPNSENNVYLVGVVFPFQESWSNLYSNYISIKNMLITKYGKPTECVEEFDTLYEPSDDKDRMYQTKMERCKYKTSFDFHEGKIIENISVAEMDCYVSLLYADEIGYKVNNESAIDDL